MDDMGGERTALSPGARYRLCVMRLCEHSFVAGRRPEPEQLEELLLALRVPLAELEREVAASFESEVDDALTYCGGAAQRVR